MGKPLLVLVGYDLAVVAGYKVEHWNWVALPHIPLALFGSAIGVILAFRNQSSYGRWWEARTLWGSLVNNSRSWARQVTTVMMPLNDAEAGELKEMQRRMVYHQIAYVHALRQHLRGLEPWKELVPLLSEQELIELRDQKNVPLAMQQQMVLLLRECQSAGMGGSGALAGAGQDPGRSDWTRRVEQNASRTRRCRDSTTTFHSLFVQIYCMLLPLALVINMGWYTPLGSTLVGFIFLALDKIGRDLGRSLSTTLFMTCR